MTHAHTDTIAIVAESACTDDHRSLPCTCLRLRRIARQITSVYDAALEPHGVSIVTYAVLTVLHHESPLTLSILAERVGTDRTTLSRTVERMRCAGLVAACTGDDRRERRLSLTAHGAQAFRDARESWRETVTHLEERYGAERLAALHALLADLEAVAQDDLATAAE
ncbi:MAG: MarR family transcriptional regulator [Pseudomonadota bacterium]